MPAKEAEASATGRLAAIYIYPVKSTRRVALEASAVEPQGLRMDRRWMVADPAGKFMSQRTAPRLALIRAAASPEGLRVQAPGQEDLVVAQPDGAARASVEVWGDSIPATEADSRAHEWFSRFLGTECRLVYLDDPASRPVETGYGKPGDVVSFADSFPALLISEASLEALNARLDEPVPMHRFRPNLVVSGVEAFAEDTWDRVRIGEMDFLVAKPCARCIVTTVDQETGVQGKEPLRTLETFRRGEDGKVFFGQNLIPLHPGTIRQGDIVQPMLRR